VPGASSTSDEISNLFKATDESWDVQQRSLATHRPVYRPQVAKPGGGGYAGRPVKEGEDAGAYQKYSGGFNNFTTRPPPPGYICFRCGKSGHYLNMCPTNGDVTFDGPRLKKTTGIPKMFLKTVKREDAEGKNVMVTANGDLVVAQPNESAFNDFMDTQKAYNVKDEDIPAHLKCKICVGLLNDATVVPCCKSVFCQDCIRYVCVRLNMQERVFWIMRI
jgi:protein MPE1